MLIESVFPELNVAEGSYSMQELRKKHLPKKIVSTVKLCIPAEAFFSESLVTIAASYTCKMPTPFENI